ncbi:MAG: hypothetical protein ABI687_06820 [Flavitalea sp.]
MKKIVFAFALFLCAVPVHAQLLKKLKDKVNKKIDKATGTEDSSGNNSSGSNSSGNTSSGNSSGSAKQEENKKVQWCDTIKEVSSDGVAYTMAYSSPARMGIVYQESSLGLANDAKGYRLILSQYENGKQQFVVVENGKVIDTDTKVKDKYLAGGMSEQFSAGSSEQRNDEMKKYIIADSTNINTPKTTATSVTVKKIDDDQMSTTLAIARQTDEYKNMSAAEKKEFEESMQVGLKKNNEMAGQTFSAPAQQASSLAYINGYKLIVKGKNYGKFMMPPVVDVSRDETSVFAVGIDEKSLPVLIANGKKTMLDKNKYAGMSGKIIRSPDRSKFAYLEPKKMSEAELMDYSNGKAKMSFNVLKKDGSSVVVTDYNSSGKFTLSNSGNLISVNETTGEVYSDGKKVGKFELKDGSQLNTEAMLMGADVSKISYYNGDNGSINYLDGSTRKLGVMFPQVVSLNGKSYLSWFRKCRNDIYIGRLAY